jgi:hypothetical protein
MYCRLNLCCSVRLYPDFGWCAYGTYIGVNWLWVQIRVWVHVQVHVGIRRVCLFLRIIVRFTEVTFRFRDL